MVVVVTFYIMTANEEKSVLFYENDIIRVLTEIGRAMVRRSLNQILTLYFDFKNQHFSIYMWTGCFGVEIQEKI